MRLTRFFTLALLLVVATAASAEDFPLRAKFPGAVPISLGDLGAKYRDVVVDVRSKFEFDSIHIADAVHLPLKDQSFAGEAKALQGANDPRPHQALAGRTPMVVWRAGVSGPLAGNAVDMTLRLDDATASPTCPPRPQQQQTPRVA